MKRYNSVYNGSYTKPHEMVEETLGDWVWYEDVERLLEERDVLMEALEGMFRYGNPPTNFSCDYIELQAWRRANAAIAKAKKDYHETM